MGYISSLQYADIIVKEMRINLKGFPIAKNINSRVVNNLLNQYLLYVKYYGPVQYISRKGVAVKWSKNTYLFSAKIKSILKYDNLIILNFFLALYDLAKSGKIEYKLYDPETAKRGEIAKGKVKPSLVVAAGVGSGIRNIAIIAVAAAAIYLTAKFKR